MGGFLVRPAARSRVRPTSGRVCGAVWVAVLTAALVGCAPGTPPPAQPISAVPSPAAAQPDVAQPAVAQPAPAQPAPAPGPAVTIVLDPGHNGGNGAGAAAMSRPVPDGRGGRKPCNTTGASTPAGYTEHAFTFDVTMRLAQHLRAAGVMVRSTRPDDHGVGPCVDRRAEIANTAGAAAVISVHGDGAAPGGHGFHVATSAPPLSPSQGPPSAGLADAVVAGMIGRGFVPSTYVGHGGLDPRADLAGLNLARIPAVLVECANMRNPAEAASVASPEGRERYAAALADGILRWLHR